MARIITSDYSLDLIYPPFNQMSDEELFDFCLQNKDLAIERDKNGELLFLPSNPTFCSIKKASLLGELDLWNRDKRKGIVFDSFAGFFLPDTSMRSPDAAWIGKEKLDSLSEEKRQGFVYIAPDFVVEFISPWDNRNELNGKMEKWRSNGVKLGWLIDAKNETVFIYRADGTISKVEAFVQSLSGENVLPDFEFDLKLLQ